MINALFGPLTGLAFWTRLVGKIIFSLVMALVIYTVADRFLTSIALPTANIGPNASLDRNGTLTVNGLTGAEVVFCGTLRGMQNNCGDDDILLGVSIVPTENPEQFANPLPIVRRVADVLPFAQPIIITHSVHTLSRSLEQRLFNGPNDPPSSLKLCAGTPKRLGKAPCQISTNFEAALDKLIGPVISSTRLSTLLLGPIQFFTLTIFVYLVIEALGRAARWAHAPPTMIETYEDADQAKWRLKTGAELEGAISHYATAPVRSITDRLMARAIILKSFSFLDETKEEQAPKLQDLNQRLASANSDEKLDLVVRALVMREHGVSEDRELASLEGYREFLVAEAEEKLDVLSTLNEIMLKLAFAGTVIGIAYALFSARLLDAANVVDELLAKASMFSDIGSAFGTTLVGVALSIIASLFVQMAYSNWLGRINWSFDLIVSISDEIDPSIAARYFGQLEETTRSDRPESSFVEQIGWLGLLLGLLGLSYAVVLYWNDLIEIWRNAVGD